MWIAARQPSVYILAVCSNASERAFLNRDPNDTLRSFLYPAKALSTVASTAAFDKHPQSKARGITLDLGFSAFFMDLPDQVKGMAWIGIYWVRYFSNCH